MDNPRVGYGLVALRKRYRVRAEVLTGDDGFAQACALARRAWNTMHARYAVHAALDSHGIPQALARDYVPALEAFEASDHESFPEDPEASAADRYTDVYARQQRRKAEPTLRAYDDWQATTWRLVDAYFPACDFPALSDDEAHPAAAFLGNAVNGPQVKALRYQVDRLIGEVCLDVRDATLDEDDPVLALGLYPGITPRDIKAVAVEIAEAVNARYQERLPLVRIVDLREQGLSCEAIGDRLGMTARAVKDALASLSPG